MPRDRLTWVIVTLAAIGLLASLYWQQQDLARSRAYNEAHGIVTNPTPHASSSPVTAPAAAPPDFGNAPMETAAPASGAPDKTATLKSSVAELHFSTNDGGLADITLSQHRAEGDRPVELSMPLVPAIGAISQNPNNWRDDGYDVREDQAAGQVTLTKQVANNLTITKVYSLGAKTGLQDPYQIGLALTFQNRGNQPFTNPGYFVSTGAAQPIHQSDLPLRTVFDWYRDGKLRSINVSWFNPSSFLFFPTGPGKEVYTDTGDQILWTSVASQYFATILATQNEAGDKVWARRAPVPGGSPQQGPWLIEGALGMPGFTLQPGETRTVNFAIYGGPKEYSRLARLPNDQWRILDFGWIAPLGKLLLISLNQLHAWVKSYALAIILLTIAIRSLLWPLQNASMKSMRKMSKLSPLINDLRTKYKDDPQRMNQEMMKLYKEYGVNPLAGCFPMLVQIPIFFSFYSMLGTAIELRNSSFLWVKDLSQPDTIAYLGSFPINILPLIMVAVQLWQLQVTPKTGDPSQQRMLYITPVIFLVFCYNYASALALYWTVSTLFTVVQTYLTRRQTEPQLTKVSAAPTVAKKRSYR
ncbi:MAG: membrane protein insertase YidC [Verrucomicrobia bacterium]|nr:membrane protein insertase YidC [Verrucomicrobiota bacterium]